MIELALMISKQPFIHLKTTMAALASRKRRPSTTIKDEEGHNCFFCAQVPAAVSVEMPVLIRKKRSAVFYCLTCYYTTSAVRQEHSKHVSICNEREMEEQLVPIQQLFSEAYLDLQKQLQDEADRAFSQQKSDPLAMLHSGLGLAPRRMTHRAPRPDAKKMKEGNISDGGFLRNVPLPERLLRTQKEQAWLQQAQITRMNQLASRTMERFGTTSVYQRRKSSKKSIWNLAMDPNTAEGEKATDMVNDSSTCSCGSINVRSFGNITSRNQDLKKGETWGMKDRGDDVVSRYQCDDCGKMWNEEG